MEGGREGEEGGSMKQGIMHELLQVTDPCGCDIRSLPTRPTTAGGKGSVYPFAQPSSFRKKRSCDSTHANLAPHETVVWLMALLHFTAFPPNPYPVKGRRNDHVVHASRKRQQTIVGTGFLIADGRKQSSQT